MFFALFFFSVCCEIRCLKMFDAVMIRTDIKGKQTKKDL
jgi:hypothetical protein